MLKPSKGWRLINLRELWAYRELLYFLTWRDVKVRYKQSFFGGAWAIIQPVALMVVLSSFFGRFANDTSASTEVPAPLFFFAGLVPWTLFTQSLQWSSSSLVAGSNLVRKVYFPRLIMPFAATGSYVFDYLIAMAVLFGMMIAYGFTPGLRALWLVPFTFLALLSALGLGTILSALNARYRDFGYTVPFLIQLWFFVSPVAYSASSSFVPEYLRPVYGLNPMAGVIEGIRWALIDAAEPPDVMTAVSATVAFIVFVIAIFYFQKTERTFADII